MNFAKSKLQLLLYFFPRTGTGGLFLRSIAVALAWLIFPRWVFMFLVLYFYFVPTFRAFALMIPFILFLFSSFIFPAGVLSSAFLGLLFFLIIGTKEFLFIEREEAYKGMIFLFLFVSFLGTFHVVAWWELSWLWLWILVAVGFLIVEFDALRHGYHAGNIEQSLAARRMRIAFVCIAFFIWQGGIVVSFLPINFFYQTILLFISVVALTETAIDYARDELSQRRLFMYFAVFFVVSVATLAAIPWGI